MAYSSSTTRIRLPANFGLTIAQPALMPPVAYSSIHPWACRISGKIGIWARARASVGSPHPGRAVAVGRLAHARVAQDIDVQPGRAGFVALEPLGQEHR